MTMLIVACVLLGLFLSGCLLDRRPRCADTRGHDFDYGRKSVTGWGIVRCTRCDYEDLY